MAASSEQAGIQMPRGKGLEVSKHGDLGRPCSAKFCPPRVMQPAWRQPQQPKSDGASDVHSIPIGPRLCQGIVHSREPHLTAEEGGNHQSASSRRLRSLEIGMITLHMGGSYREGTMSPEK
ncbi:hypothetical protein CIHG_09913 [Coccidioides immitis H538.4]|uniref:Uncharacterized protein n=1 Tax=Coccidioides immitis H538.4 TaxID=396776 RepID=A0A0J8S3N7_COCIT|nr:hypothetical protein CIHG_09913 [Coccidioides immitis H538.4]